MVRLNAVLVSLAIAALAVPVAARAQEVESGAIASDDLQVLNLCQSPAPNQLQVLVTAESATDFDQLFAQLQQRWPQATLCFDPPTEVSQGGLWIRVAEVGDRDRAEAIAREVSNLSGYPAILRAFLAEG